jgi:hypothetical protein
MDVLVRAVPRTPFHAHLCLEQAVIVHVIVHRALRGLLPPALMIRNVFVDGRHLVEVGDLSPEPRQVSVDVRRCLECDEDAPSDAGTRLCGQCGAAFVTTTRLVAATRTAPSTESLDEALELLGLSGTFRALLLQQEQSKSQPISKAFLSTLGRVEVNARNTILYDAFLNVGDLQILGVVASFSWLPPDEELPLRVEARLFRPDPPHAAAPLPPTSKGCIAVCDRGVVSFAKKLVAASEAGCAALVVVQTEGFVFPFEMQDSAQEVGPGVGSSPIPVIMVNASDGALLSSLASASSQRATASLRIIKRERECAICAEEYERGHSVLRLPCRHAYHAACVERWLTSHSSCPICRKALPSSAPAAATDPPPAVPAHDHFTS